MANLEIDQQFSVRRARRQAKAHGHLQRTQTMLMAAGLAACGIVAVAAAMMGTLF